jgi:hypothetical protein
MPDSSERSWGWWLQFILETGRLVFAGLLTASVSADSLLSIRNTATPLITILHVMEILACLWLIPQPWLKRPWLTTSSQLKKDREREGIESIALLLAVLSFGVFWFLRRHEGMAMVMAIVLAVFWWIMGRIHRRFFQLAVMGWLLSGTAALVTHWPAEQEFLLAFALGGAATALQGILEARRFIHETFPQEDILRLGPQKL